MQIGLTLTLALLLCVAGITHFLKSRQYLRIVPSFLPFRLFIVQASGVLELMAGVGLLFHSTRYDAGLAVLIMMVGFLPLHIWDVFRERPAMGSKMLAWIRLPLQGVLIVWSWYVWRGF